MLAGGAALCVLAAGPLHAAPPTAAAAEAFVAALGDDVVAIARRPGLGHDERLALIVARLERAIDLELLGRLALGRHWRGLGAPERTAFLDAYRDYGVALLGRLLRGYAGETFELIASRPVGETDALVGTRILRPDGPPIGCEWRVRALGPDRLVVIDIVAEGISFLVSQRDEFAAIVQRSGFDGLLATLREKAKAQAV
jgi:phospholipid transport system substrate-binding protein